MSICLIPPAGGDRGYARECDRCKANSPRTGAEAAGSWKEGRVGKTWSTCKECICARQEVGIRGAVLKHEIILVGSQCGLAKPQLVYRFLSHVSTLGG